MRGFALRSLAVAVAVAVAVVVVAGSPAFAQNDVDGAFDVQLFEYAAGPESFLTVSGAEVTAPNEIAFDFLLTFITNPFTIVEVDPTSEEITEERTNVVESVLAGELIGSYGLTESMQLVAALPIVFRMAGEGLESMMALPASEELGVTGLGDLRVELKAKLYDEEGIKLAVLPGLSVPTSVGSGGSDFLGDDLPTARLRGAVSWIDSLGKIRFGANVGLLFRKPRDVYSSTIGQQLTYGAALAYAFNDRFEGIAEVFGRTGLIAFDLDSSPLELAGAGRFRATRSLSVMLGGGAGLVRGIGSPDVRVFISIGYAKDVADDDGDGIPNANDACPIEPEDRDNFEDSDGCPDLDNDGDNRDDTEDRCPLEAEDIDGFEDDDGCPESDNDGDKIPDLDDMCPDDVEDKRPPFPEDGCPADLRDSDDDGMVDRFDECPDQQEDRDEFEDWDGCPERDNDGDGLADAIDECPLCKEDPDGFADDDGCPELDNDNDGYADDVDKCPDEPETVNGVNDFDGCPDGGGAQLVRLEGNQMAIAMTIDFTRTNAIDRKSLNVVDQIAAVMIGTPDVIEWRIVRAARRVGTTDETRAISQAQADELRDYLVGRGVKATIEALGAVDDEPALYVVARERKPDDAPKVCPPGAKVEPRPEPDR